MENVVLTRPSTSIVHAYELISSIQTTEEKGFVTFGARLYYGNHKNTFVDIKDISPDKNLAEEFARRCVNSRVSIDHVYDVLDDYLGIVYGL
ncbi:DUF6514 family protein [Candidatus Soleaferrea massiliensis]|uniref:DUF6514 family protein n=1 Tax=Candidatus Soleaferrea massiliensis TaxID=1470354 RepID=UPI00058BFEB0|nr:DUF6514 family protein [Candidatus Soleaferrea massiliensis]